MDHDVYSYYRKSSIARTITPASNRADQLVNSYFTYLITTVIVRPFNTYGPDNVKERYTDNYNSNRSESKIKLGDFC